jgi:hypothetical protein
LSRDDLIERAGVVCAAKLSEIDDALRAQRAKNGVDPGRGGQAQRDQALPPTGGLRQAEKERTPKPAKVDLVRTISGPWPLNNKITICGWSTKRYQ